jgi:carbamoyl-phosphate synthase large subunit
VFPGSTEIGLEIFKSLASTPNIELFGGGLGGSNHGEYVFKNWLVVPSVFDSDCIEKLNDLIAKHKIDYIFPAHDDALLILAKSQHLLNATLVGSPLETIEITSFKSKTYHKLADHLPTPKTVNINQSDLELPIFCKPDRGQGSQGAQLICTRDELKFKLRSINLSDFLFLEYLPGKEYTVDCFSCRKKGLLFVGGRERIRTRNGISMATCDSHDSRFVELAKKISSVLKFHGAWFFQLKEAKDKSGTLLEIATRIAGTSGFQRGKGINLPYLSLLEAEGEAIDISINNFSLTLDRALQNRYKSDLKYSSIVVNLEDTLVYNEQVNTELVKLLYQAFNQGLRLILYTQVDCYQEILERYKLGNLFDSVVSSLNEISNFKECIYVSNQSAVKFNYSLKSKFTIFTTNMIEVLINDRR